MSPARPFSDSIPIGSLSSAEAFALATEHMHDAREKLDASLIAGGLLRLEAAFALVPRGVRANLMVSAPDFLLASLRLDAPAGLLTAYEDATLRVRRGQPVEGFTASSQSAYLSGSQRDFDSIPWIRDRLGASLAAFEHIGPALSSIREASRHLRITIESNFQAQFLVDHANISMFANLFGFEKQLSTAEAIILSDLSVSESLATQRDKTKRRI